MSSDPNRPRPRSSKKRRAVQSGEHRRARPTRGPAAAGDPRRRDPRPAGPPSAARAGSRRPGSRSARSSCSRSAPPSPAARSSSVAARAEPARSDRRRVSSVPGASARRAAPNCPTAQPPAAPAGQTRVVTIETAKGADRRSRSRPTCRRSRPATSSRSRRAASTTASSSTASRRSRTARRSSSRAAIPTGTGTGGPGYEIQDEPVTTPYVRGTVAMARTPAPNSVGSQFFIVLDDKDQSVLASANTYQIIGSVTAGHGRRRRDLRGRRRPGDSGRTRSRWTRSRVTNAVIRTAAQEECR